MNIYEKLAIIQQELKAPKDQYNSFGKYSYRSCEDILEAVKPLLNKTKTVLIMSDRIAEVGARTYLAATVKLIDTESERGESVENTAFAREDEDKKGFDAMQLTGATSSYANAWIAVNGNTQNLQRNTARALPDREAWRIAYGVDEVKHGE